MKWNWIKIKNGNYRAGASINGEVYVFEVTEEGRYFGTKNGEIVISGFIPLDAKNTALYLENEFDKSEDTQDTIVYSTETKPSISDIPNENEFLVCPVEVTKTDEVTMEKDSVTESVGKPADIVNDCNNKFIVNKTEDGLLEILYEGSDKIKYTLDGKEITQYSKVYKAPVSIENAVYLNAVAYLNGKVIGKLDKYNLI